jgi:surface polysaccharide O-acyltransferase-like enzyme
MTGITLPRNDNALTRDDYRFVTNTRFVSMVGVVALHSELMSITLRDGWLNIVLNQTVKFSTICFFMISGFLLGDRLEDASPRAYMARRLRTVALPWAIWVGVHLSMSLAIDHVARGPAARPLLWHINNTVIANAYWFVPNILLSLAVLLLFRRWLDAWWFGAALAVTSLAHGLNLHVRMWQNTQHNSAFTGFIVFLWLGYQIRRHYGWVRSTLAKTPWGILWALVLATWSLALGETWLLATRFGDGFDFLSTLRVGNVLYSLAVFALMFKVKRNVEPPGMDARRFTFGIYLLHPIVFGVVGRAFKVAWAHVLGIAPMAFNANMADHVRTPLQRLGVQVLVFVMVYGISWAAVALLARTPVARYLGVRDG